MSYNDEALTNYPSDTCGSYRPAWTIMIYLAGDNNLSANSIDVMQEVEAAKYSEDVRVLACFDSNTPYPKGARYLEINHRRHHLPYPPPFKWGLHNDMVGLGHIVYSPDFCNDLPAEVGPVTEPIAEEGLARFLKWALRYHPADRYMLIVFGHGTAVAGNTFLADENPPSFLRLRDFGNLLKRHFGGSKPKLSILACDNCVMNGIEAADEVRYEVDYMLGSQGLMLAVGWPYRKIINAVVESLPTDKTITIAHKVLKVCARNLLDFALMERSSEQAICNLRMLRTEHTVINALKKLSAELQKGMATNPTTGELCYPLVVDAVRLARLKAQSYWNETFVDVYDFCDLLRKKCLEFAAMLGDLCHASPCLTKTRDVLNKIAWACESVLWHFRFLGQDRNLKPEDLLVPYSYYICPELQYSHGLSIFFPWTLPEDPIIFDPVDDDYSIHRREPREYQLKTAFDEYSAYDFTKPERADWARFLISFFKATLRNVRTVDYNYPTPAEGISGKRMAVDESFVAPLVDLQKTSSDTGPDEYCSGMTIKNYPRRYYLSPADCRRRFPTKDAARRGRSEGHLSDQTDSDCPCGPVQSDRRHRVHYLGWNIRGLLAEVIDYHEPPPSGSAQLREREDQDSESTGE
jgi:hypothetical protein